MTTRPIRRALLSAVLLALAAVAVAACGSSDATSETTATATSAASAFPVTIDNRRGAVEIAAQPRRVVALDFDSADAAIALGVAPVGMAEIDYAPGKVQPWTRAALKGETPELFPYVDGPPLEQIAALHPDLIVATNSYGLDGQWAKLNAIAPVVAGAGAEGADSWETTTERIGKALGRSAEATKLIADTKARVAGARTANPGFDGATIAFFNYYEGDAWAITSGDASITFLEQLGFELSPKVAALRGDQGRAAVSPERFSLLDADVLMGTSPTGDVNEELAKAPTFQRLAVVRRGSFVGLDLVTATSIAFPSALSVQWGVEQIVPKLAQATAAES